MGRMMKALAWLCLIALTAILPFGAALLPADREELVRRSYASWTGVIRIWKCEGWACGAGSLNGWLNGCAETFEKAHPGVYVEIRSVGAQELAAFSDAVNPPDMLIYYPGVLEAPYGLTELDQDMNIRRSLTEAGLWQGARYACPVALGGYAMAINSALLPNGAEDVSAAEADGILNAPADGEGVSWSAALLGMFAGSSISEELGSMQAGSGVDLGLPAAEEDSRPEPVERAVREDRLPSVLPENFREQKSVLSEFTVGEVAAIPVTQREIRRLMLLTDSGKGPDFRIERMGETVTDQIALCSAVAKQDVGAAALCRAFMELLLSEGMQERLKHVYAFPVIRMGSLYGGTAMAAVEESLQADRLTMPPAFSDAWRKDAAALMDLAEAGKSTGELFERLAGEER